MNKELLAIAQRYRRELHKIPEIGFSEHKTSAYLKEALKKLKNKWVITDLTETGFIADLILSDKYELWAFRADIDALPAMDKSDNDFTSTHDNCAHNCGHDSHMACLLTFAELIDQDNHLSKNIRLIFQPAEEMFAGGAIKMIEAGCLTGVSRIFGCHNDPQLKVGEISINHGIMSTFGNQFCISIEGQSAHGTLPHLAKDALSEGIRFIEEMKRFKLELVNPIQPFIMSICQFNAGESSNIIANTATITGSYRCFDKELNKKIDHHFHDLMEESRRRGFKVTNEKGYYPGIINEDSSVDMIITAAKEQGVNVLNLGPMNGSEDYSYYLEQVKGCFFFLGSGNNEISNPLHSNPFYLDERCIVIAGNIYHQLVK